MKPITLFDMDGTLSPPREVMIEGMLDCLISLSDVSDIGIVTGSGIEYIKQQCAPLINNIEKLNSDFTIFPCNGTQVYKINREHNINCTFASDMKKYIGRQYRELLAFILSEQAEFIKAIISNHDKQTPDVSGTFTQYRGSMLNWCLIGRDATMNERKSFTQFDKKYGARESLIKQLNVLKSGRGWDLDFALGGSTSIDIYPIGWDKTYVLNHIDTQSKDVYFIGDRCGVGGNDKALYEKINNDIRGRAYETVSPDNTLQIVDEIKKQIRNQKRG